MRPVDRMVFEVQMRKAARSVSSNISEGHERDVGLIRETTRGLEPELAECRAVSDEVGRMLTALNASLRRKWKRPMHGAPRT